MSKTEYANQLSLLPVDNRRLAILCGQCDEHLRHLEKHLGVEINSRGHEFQIHGEPKQVKAAETVLSNLYKETEHDDDISPAKLHLFLKEATVEKNQRKKNPDDPNHDIVIRTRETTIKARNRNQLRYIKQIMEHDICFGIGPAGTGKTYLAVACAVHALEKGEVRRLILVRPAVEAGERLGFLPGDLSQKVDPYLRPLYDALYEMLGFERVAKLIERNVIEVAPLAYMRGRSLNDAFIILDESQNTTKEQMKMFLTRIGFGSKAVITGDVTQVDLPHGTASGLQHGLDVLQNIKAISFTNFQAGDVVRHPLVQSIVQAYEHYESNNKSTQRSGRK